MARPFDTLRHLISQPAIARTLPWVGGVTALAVAGFLANSIIPRQQRILYSDLSDGERSTVASALDKAAIVYRIDAGTGSITVGDRDFYKARMLVAADGAVATPKTGSDMLDALPLGASRSLEGERLRAARERELELTIKEIDGIEAVRVHLAEGEKSVFIRDASPPTASVMVKLVRDRQLGQSQVSALVNLVSASVAGLSPDAVRVIDQHGRLLTDPAATKENDRIDLQSRMEEKLRTQLSQLLTPILGEGNFTTEIQVDLDMDQVTSARESYDKQGVVRSETAAQSQTAGGEAAGGIPGVLSNTPPPTAIAKPVTAPQPAVPSTAVAAVGNGESSSTRNYELGREVAVSNASPGKLKRLSVAVAVSSVALKKTKPADVDQIKQLVSAAVGADPARGDQVAVAVRNFSVPTVSAVAFYETPWFAMLVRNLVVFVIFILVLFLIIRPLVKALTKRVDPLANANRGTPHLTRANTTPNDRIDAAALGKQVGVAQQIIEDKPDAAMAALRQMMTAVDAGPAR